MTITTKSLCAAAFSLAFLAAPAAAVTVGVDTTSAGRVCTITPDTSVWQSQEHAEHALASLSTDFPAVQPELKHLKELVATDGPAAELPAAEEQAIDEATRAAGMEPGEAATILRAATYAGISGFYAKPLTVSESELVHAADLKVSPETTARSLVDSEAAQRYLLTLLEQDGYGAFTDEVNAGIDECAARLATEETEVQQAAAISPAQTFSWATAALLLAAGVTWLATMPVKVRVR